MDRHSILSVGQSDKYIVLTLPNENVDKSFGFSADQDNGIGRVYFISTLQDSTERHLYSVNLRAQNRLKHVSNDPAYYEADFSPEGGYYVLYYNGPDVPTTSLYSTTDPSFNFVIEDNKQLRNRLARYNIASKLWRAVPLADGQSTFFLRMMGMIACIFANQLFLFRRKRNGDVPQ